MPDILFSSVLAALLSILSFALGVLGENTSDANVGSLANDVLSPTSEISPNESNPVSPPAIVQSRTFGSLASADKNINFSHNRIQLKNNTVALSLKAIMLTSISNGLSQGDMLDSSLNNSH